MKVLLDTNVVLDFLLKRDGFYDFSHEIMQLINDRKIDGYLCATTVTTIHYVVSKTLGVQNSLGWINILLENFSITNVDKNTLLKSLQNCGSDFEDSVIYSSAENENIDYIVTRDKEGFKNSPTKTLSPEEFLKIL